MTETDRGRRLYDWWGSHAGLYGVVDRLSRPIRARGVRELDVDAGDTVLDLGCGPGSNAGLLRDAVGESGRIVAVDYSAAMARRADGRGDCEAVLADAGSLPLRDRSLDAAFASLALSAMPDPEAVARGVRDALAPGGRFVVVDGRPPSGLGSSAVRWLYDRVANWQGHDPFPVVERVFPEFEVVATYDAGLSAVAVAEKPTA